MSENEKLRSIKEIDYDKYVDISSLEKLAAYGIKYLEDNNITTTWTNLVIATYYLFPRKFAISEDFIDFPNAERLNRTLMHLVPPKGRNYAIGSTKVDYKLTPLGKQIAAEVEKTICGEAKTVGRKQEIISKTKNTSMKCYLDIVQSNEYKQFLNNGDVIIDYLWSLYKVIPFTQKDKICNSLKSAKLYANNNDDIKCSEFIEALLRFIEK